MQNSGLLHGNFKSLNFIFAPTAPYTLAEIRTFDLLKKRGCPGGEQTRVLSISFIVSFSPLYR
jgi:hypothetical protein